VVTQFQERITGSNSSGLIDDLSCQCRAGTFFRLKGTFWKKQARQRDWSLAIAAFIAEAAPVIIGIPLDFLKSRPQTELFIVSLKEYVSPQTPSSIP
jgi:hypothetical protein